MSAARVYARPPGGHPAQTDTLTGKAVFTEAYAVIPAGVQRDIVTSYLPHWDKTRLWILARPLSGFAETFSHYVMEVEPGGGSKAPDPDQVLVNAILFVTHGQLQLTFEIGDEVHDLVPGSYVYLPVGERWSLHNTGDETAVFHWVRKTYNYAFGALTAPDRFVTHEDDHTPVPMPGTDGVWATTRFVDPTDLLHDMHVNIVTFQPGGSIPFEETHVMEHGIYILEGKAAYKLNRDWVEVEAGDYLWLRAFCPQACIAAGPGPFRYLLYKDVNRHARLAI